MCNLKSRLTQINILGDGRMTADVKQLSFGMIVPYSRQGAAVFAVCAGWIVLWLTVVLLGLLGSLSLSLTLSLCLSLSLSKGN